MESLLVVTGILTLGAITPGPNNFVVTREAARAGWSAALRASLGIVAGGLILLLLVASGVGTLFDSRPILAPVIAFLCSAYLFASGASLVTTTFLSNPTRELPVMSRIPAGTLGLLFFQFINPKAWSLMLTVTSVVGSTRELASFIPRLALLFAFVSFTCLSLWAGAGLLLSGWLRRTSIRNWFDRLTGAAFMAFALLLVFAVLDANP